MRWAAALACLFVVSAALADTTVAVRRTVVSSAYSDVIFWLNFENDETTNPYDMLESGASAELSSGAGDTSGTISTTHSAIDPGSYVTAASAKVGGFGLHVQGGIATEKIAFTVGASQEIAFAAKGTLGFWMYQTASCGSVNILTLGNTSNGVGKLTIACSSTQRINANYYDASITPGPAATATTTTANNATPTGAWRFIQVHWDDTADANRLSLDIWDGASTATTNNAVAYDPDGTWASRSLELGSLQILSTYDSFFDNFMISSDPDRDFIVDTGPCGTADATVELMNCVKSPL